MKNIIEIKNLSKSFGEVKAVDDLSFRVKEGELFAFLGVNGAGKSTTINIICGCLAADGGTVTVDGHDASRAEAVKNATVLNIKKSFFRLLYAQHNVELAEKVQQKAGRYSRSLHTGAWNKIKAQYLLSRLNSLKSEANNELQKAQLAMLVSLNKELNSQIKVRGDFKPVEVELDLPRLNLWAMEFRPELKSALYKLEMDNISVKLSLARRYPNILLGIGYDRQGEDNINDENIQATLALKLPFGYDYGTQLKQKRAEQRQSNLKRAAIEDSIRSEVLEAYNNLMFWQEETAVRINTWDAINKELGSLNYNTLSKEEAIKVFNYYYEAGVDYLEGIKEHMLAIAKLELAVGQDIRE